MQLDVRLKVLGLHAMRASHVRIAKVPQRLCILRSSLRIKHNDGWLAALIFMSIICVQFFWQLIAPVLTLIYFLSSALSRVTENILTVEHALVGYRLNFSSLKCALFWIVVEFWSVISEVAVGLWSIYLHLNQYSNFVLTYNSNK